MTNDSLTQLLETLKTDLINSMQAHGRFASGQTAKQLTVTNNGNTAQLQAPAYLQFLETGRGPTSSGAPIGDPPMIQRIQDWCRAKGIPDMAAWAIKKSIDKKGYKGISGLISEPLSDDNINLRLNPALNDIADAACNEITVVLNLPR
jgi:hypothetical protein